MYTAASEDFGQPGQSIVSYSLKEHLKENVTIATHAGHSKGADQTRWTENRSVAWLSFNRLIIFETGPRMVILVPAACCLFICSPNSGKF